MVVSPLLLDYVERPSGFCIQRLFCWYLCSSPHGDFIWIPCDWLLVFKAWTVILCGLIWSFRNHPSLMSGCIKPPVLFELCLDPFHFTWDHLFFWRRSGSYRPQIYFNSPQPAGYWLIFIQPEATVFAYGRFLYITSDCIRLKQRNRANIPAGEETVTHHTWWDKHAIENYAFDCRSNTLSKFFQLGHLSLFLDRSLTFHSSTNPEYLDSYLRYSEMRFHDIAVSSFSNLW